MTELRAPGLGVAVVLAGALALSGCTKTPPALPEVPPAPAEAPLPESTPAPLKTWPAEAIDAVGTWVCPPWQRAEDPGHKGARYEVLWVRADQSIQSRGLRRQDEGWQWIKGDYDEEVLWFAGSRQGLRQVHYYLCTRVPNNNHWCKLLLAPQRRGEGYGLELLDLLRPSHEDEPYGTAAYAERVLDRELAVNCRYQRIAGDGSLSEDDVAVRVAALPR
jgi:hypothetical protein